MQVPCYSINGCRKPAVVKYSVEKCLVRYTANRQGLLTKCTPINENVAKKLLDNGYKHLSPFKKWCPIKVCTMNGKIKLKLMVSEAKCLNSPHYYSIFSTCLESRDLICQNGSADRVIIPHITHLCMCISYCH